MLDIIQPVATEATSTLKELQNTAQNLSKITEQLKSALNDLAPNLKETSTNVKDLTSTVKRQPWRLIWPSTKEYPADARPAPAADTITIRKSTKSRLPRSKPSTSREQRGGVIYTRA